MLEKPASCSGCPLEKLGAGFMNPSLASEDSYKVALIGEALGEDESNIGLPFVGKAGFTLTRLIKWAGLDREKFDIWNTVWCRPPDNKLEGEVYEKGAVDHCGRQHWKKLVSRAAVLVPMGNVATNVLLGRKGILSIRGYVFPGEEGKHVLPTVHPSFIQRGNSKWSAAFINDLQKAVYLGQHGLPAELLDYTLDPLPIVAYRWGQDYVKALEADPTIKLAFDIETPGKPEEEDELDTSDDLPDNTWHIFRIGFSYRANSALSIPWEPPFLPAIKLILGTGGDKVVWNAGFDVPRVRRAGIAINGTIHDGMVAWHILHSDLPKRLGFVSTFTCPFQPAWKHLSSVKPAFYNATDADVEWRSMEVIERELRRTGLWDVYKRDVLDLEPILIHMRERGMPVDQGIREDRAIKLAGKQGVILQELEGQFPIETRKIEHVYVNTPKDTTGLLTRPGTRLIHCCPVCGIERPRKDHFKTYVRKSNPCAGLLPVERVLPVTEYYRLSEFKPSREQLIRYHTYLNRPMPLVYDRKTGKKRVSFGEKEMKKLILKYPLDEVYELVLKYREIDKLAGTYIGRPSEVQGPSIIPG